MPTPATPAMARPRARAAALTQLGSTPIRVVATMSSEAALTAVPVLVRFRNRKTTTVAAMASARAISLVNCIDIPNGLSTQSV